MVHNTKLIDNACINLKLFLVKIASGVDDNVYFLLFLLQRSQN